MRMHSSSKGSKAGGHRGSFDDSDNHEDFGILALLSLVAARVDLPLIAPGGIATGPGLAGVLAAGAVAAAIGTAFLRCPEAGTIAAHRDALTQPRRTGLTRAFSVGSQVVPRYWIGPEGGASSRLKG